jgi:DNA-binding transcriptional ArsR family regulator
VRLDTGCGARVPCREQSRYWRDNGWVEACPTLTAIDSRAIPSSSMSSTESSLDRALHAISDPTRRRILQVLKEGETETKQQRPAAGGPRLCAGDIEDRIQLSQPTISHHMAILTKAGLVEATKKGQWRWYRRNEKAIRLMLKTVREEL